ncbi:hypothetical protein COE20_28720 [Bacillus cereus]|uniref:S-4TM family putative pore-forming effector n=1 Tax=Bacillus cereus TaxID=1396 RepID=UPI000BF65069|nr:S-4TM family putative pore-forming effector [Bacillus cereus]PFN14415.1 hypothetical protein COJ72_16620 [Bacillus cereus]PGY21055.1 hypothetical protein COE20_28720 [Bacillus cereus]
MDTINERQNDERNFQLKICFKHFYDKAKVLYNLHLTVSLLIPIISVLAKVSNYEYRDIIFLVSSCWIIIAMCLNIREQKLRLKAVTLQEKYDNNVLGLNENKTIMYKKIPIDEISVIVKKMKYGRDIDKIYYDGIESSDNTMAVLSAQRQNVLSDRFLREKYCLMYKVLLFSIVVVSLAIAIILKQTVEEFLIEILIPLISLISFVIQQIRKLSEEVKRNDQIGELIDKDINEWKNSKKENGKENLIQCREYQNYIFTRRLNAALIPNFVYRMFEKNYVVNKEINQSITSETRNIS